jgi:hypothetical protein
MQNLENNWQHFYKYADGFDHAPANLIYEPFVSSDKKTFKMSFNNLNDYFWNKDYTDDLVQFYFSREVDFLNRLSDEDYTPEVLNIDYDKKEITFKWYDSNINRIMHEKDIDEVCPDWKDQIKNIVKDLASKEIYKLNLYPHTFYIDDRNKVRMFDLYGCIDFEEPWIKDSYILPILGKDNTDRFLTNQEDGMINLLGAYKYGIQNNAGNWPENFLNE